MLNRATATALCLAVTIGPAAAQTVSRLDLSEWVGQWAAGDEQTLRVTMPDKKGLQIEGFASYGADDPEKVAIGAVNVGEFSVRVPSRWIRADNVIEIMIGPDGEAEPAEKAGEHDCVLGLRLDWNINWIDVTDNGKCGGLNVSFTGQYEWVVE